MYAPALVGGADVRGSLLGDATIQATFERFRYLDVAFVGIGSITEPDASRLVYGGALGAHDVRRLRDRERSATSSRISSMPTGTSSRAASRTGCSRSGSTICSAHPAASGSPPASTRRPQSAARSEEDS